MVEALEALGADVIAVPVIEIVDPPDLAAVDDAIARLGDYDWLILTSANGVDRFFARLEPAGSPAEKLGDVRIAVVGKATAARLATHGLEPDLVPADFRAEGLVEGFRERGVRAGTRVLYARALNAREVLPEALREMGAHVDVVPVYRTVAAQADPGVIGRLAAGVDVVTFTSPSTVKHFRAFLTANGVDADAFMSSTVAASIGPVTTTALEHAGITAAIEPDESTVPELVAAIAAHFSA